MQKFLASLLLSTIVASSAIAADFQTKVFDLPGKSYIHDVAPAPDGKVWYTAQRDGKLGILDPSTGDVKFVELGKGSKPHGVIMGKDGNAWITDGGQNGIVRYNPRDNSVKVWKLPEDTGYTNMNTCAIDKNGNVWFTGQSGFYGRVDVAKDKIEVWEAPKGSGAYGITSTPAGDIWFVSLASSYLGKVDLDTGKVDVIEPATPKAGPRRVWSDSKGDLWVSEWNSGNLSRYSPATKQWKSWKVPGDDPRLYAVYVDDKDIVWSSQWGSNTVYAFDPKTEKFKSVPGSASGAQVRQILGRPGEVLLPESGNARIVIVNTASTANLTN